MSHTRRHAARSCVALFLFVCALASLGCDGPGRVEYDGGRCLENGKALTAREVEDEQARVAQRIASRQPWFLVITIGVVVIAVGSNAQRALALFKARHAHGQAFGDRMRDALARQRGSPLVFAALVATSLALVAIGGGSYIYLDVDKRASERALGMLQFCHLALRTQEEQSVLDEQRHNLEAIQSTAGDIRTLVGKLPPDEQHKAQLIISQMNDALAKQGKIVGAYAERADEAQKDLTEHTAAMEKGLASVQGDLAELRSLPTDLKDIESSTRHLDGAMRSVDARFDELRSELTLVGGKVDALLARPSCATERPAEHAARPSPSAVPGLVAASPATPHTLDAGLERTHRRAL